MVGSVRGVYETGLLLSDGEKFRVTCKRPLGSARGFADCMGRFIPDADGGQVPCQDNGSVVAQGFEPVAVSTQGPAHHALLHLCSWPPVRAQASDVEVPFDSELSSDAVRITAERV